MKYGIALMEKPGIDGLTKDELDLLYKRCDHSNDDTTQVFPLELEAREHESSAMGFITPEAANLLDYDYENSGLHDYIASILDDMELEREDHHYQYKGINIYLCR